MLVVIVLVVEVLDDEVVVPTCMRSLELLYAFNSRNDEIETHT
jgi:hypothetical protein